MLLFPTLQFAMTYPKVASRTDGFEVLSIIPILALGFTALVRRSTINPANSTA